MMPLPHAEEWVAVTPPQQKDHCRGALPSRALALLVKVRAAIKLQGLPNAAIAPVRDVAPQKGGRPS